MDQSVSVAETGTSAVAAARFSAQGLVKKFKKRTVVRDVSLAVNAGEIVGLLGPNGAGKTTSFYMMVGLIAPDGGTIQIDGADVTRLPMHARARMGVGYLPQEPSVFRRLSVEDNVLAILELREDLNGAQRRQELERLLAELHVDHIRESHGLSLSGGERRRVEIARALAANPRFILLDEPFAGVDPIAVNDIHNIVEHLRDRGIGVLVTDHNVREMLRICARAYILNEGQVIADGTPEELESNETVRRVYLGADFRR